MPSAISPCTDYIPVKFLIFSQFLSRTSPKALVSLAVFGIVHSATGASFFLAISTMVFFFGGILSLNLAIPPKQWAEAKDSSLRPSGMTKTRQTTPLRTGQGLAGYAHGSRLLNAGASASGCTVHDLI